VRHRDTLGVILIIAYSRRERIQEAPRATIFISVSSLLLLRYRIFLKVGIKFPEKGVVSFVEEVLYTLTIKD